MLSSCGVPTTRRHGVETLRMGGRSSRLYDTLFTKEDPSEVEEGADFTANLNPNSLQVLTGCKVEPGLRDAVPGTRYQFERMGYFCVDRDSEAGAPVFNRTITLKDTWARIEQKSRNSSRP